MTMTDTVTIPAVTAFGQFSGAEWRQVIERDRNADGQFVYAVKSTGIYCKPSCSSRKPARQNVMFFPSPLLAEAAGYRACRRCEPKRVEERPDPQESAVRSAASYLRNHADERTRLEDLARDAGLSRLTLLRGFKRVLGVSPGEFARQQRLDRFRDRVQQGRITDAIYDAGFGSSSRLYENSSEVLGMRPRVMRAGGAGEVIRYATAASPLGRMLVAATDVGVCSIAFGKNDTELVAELRGRFPKAELEHAKANTGWFADAVEYVASQMSEHPRAAAFPLDNRKSVV